MIESVRRFLGMRSVDGYRRSTSLILVNGLAEQSETWFRSREHWQRHFDVRMPGFLVYDGPVLQERIRQRSQINVDYLTDRLAAYLDDFVQTPPYHFVASSLGGQIVVEYASRYPEKVGRLVLLCPSGMGCAENLPIVEGVRHHDYDALVRSVFFNSQLASPAIVGYYASKFASRQWRKALLQTVRGTKRHSVRPKLPKVTSPTLVICGREDQIVDPYHVQEAVQDLPDCRFVMIPRCGHAPQLEVPQIVNPMIVRFLQEESSQRKPAEIELARPRPAMAGAK
ncbi:MAG: alpha/beta hydrolase [Pirellulaceae bacterium]